MNRCESWTIKKPEHWRLDVFELWCWIRLLRVPWTSKRSNQSVLKETHPEYPLERLILKLKLQYFGHLMWRTDSFEKILMLGKIEGKREGGGRRLDDWIVSPTQWTWIWTNSKRQWRTEEPELLPPMRSQRVCHDLVTEEQQLFYHFKNSNCFIISKIAHMLPYLLLNKEWHEKSNMYQGSISQIKFYFLKKFSELDKLTENSKRLKISICGYSCFFFLIRSFEHHNWAVCSFLSTGKRKDDS